MKRLITSLVVSTTALSPVLAQQTQPNPQDLPIFGGYCEGTRCNADHNVRRFIGQVIKGGIEFGGFILLEEGGNKVLSGARAKYKDSIDEQILKLQSDIIRANHLITTEQKNELVNRMNATITRMKHAAQNGTKISVSSSSSEHNSVYYQPAVQSQIVEIETQKRALEAIKSKKIKFGKNSYSNVSSRIEELEQQLVRIRTEHTPMRYFVDHSTAASTTQTIQVLEDRDLAYAIDLYERELQDVMRIEEVTLGEKLARINQLKGELKLLMANRMGYLVKSGLVRAARVIQIAGATVLWVDIGARAILILTGRNPSTSPLLRIFAPGLEAKVWETGRGKP